MLGVVTNPSTTPSDVVMKQVAADMGVADTFRLTPVGVHFGKPGEQVDDPYFGGAGPARTGCTECGACMSGCRVGAKNTLVKNYLYLAERNGAEVFPLTTVTNLTERDGKWTIDTSQTDGRKKRTFTADQVVLAAGAWGTQQLLHRMAASGALPRLSPKLGELTRTNSEAIIGAKGAKVDESRNYSNGVAITSSFHPDEHTHVEPVRFGKGGNAMGLLQTLATDGASPVPRWRQFLGQVLRHPLRTLRLLSVRRWSERTIILLVMQSLDNSITTFLKRGRMTSRQGHGAPNPAFIPLGHRANVLTAERIGGVPGGTWSELFNIPLTAHFIGGCAIGSSAEDGVIDPYHRVFNYPGLSVVDGSAISANLGVNPSLTITAQAERAFSLWPNKGEKDERPEQGQKYKRVNPTKPKNPAVPEQAPAALRLPIVEAS